MDFGNFAIPSTYDTSKWRLSEKGIPQIYGDVRSFYMTVARLKKEVSELTNIVDVDVTNSIDELERNIAILYDLIGLLGGGSGGELSGIIDDINTLKAVVIVIQDNISAINNQINNQILTDISGIKSDITTINSILNYLSDVITNTDEVITTLQGKVTTNATAITNLNSRIGAVETKATTNATAISGLDTRVGAVETKATTNATAISGLQTSVNGKLTIPNGTNLQFIDGTGALRNLSEIVTPQKHMIPDFSVLQITLKNSNWTTPYTMPYDGYVMFRAVTSDTNNTTGGMVMINNNAYLHIDLYYFSTGGSASIWAGSSWVYLRTGDVLSFDMRGATIQPQTGLFYIPPTFV